VTQGDVPEVAEETEKVRIRRAPKLSVFMVLGAFVGFLVTLFVTRLFPSDPSVGFPATFGYFLLYGIPAGFVLGATVGLIIDAVSRRRMRTVTMQREVVGPPVEKAKPKKRKKPAVAPPD
jgi:hypothetical protein